MKKLCICFLLTLTLLTFSGCTKETGMILFNNYPITKENLLSNSSLFTAGKKIYYIFITEKPLSSNIIRVRILKREGKGEGTAKLQVVKLVYSNDFRLNKDQVYYYNDYIVMNDEGHYFMVVYDRYSLEQPIAKADFQVKN